MPRGRRPSASKSKGRSQGQKRGRAHPTSVNDDISVDLTCFDEELAAVSQSARQRRSQGQKRGRGHSASVNDDISVDFMCSDEELPAISQSSNVSRAARQRRSQGQRRGRMHSASVNDISVDLTCSDEELPASSRSSNVSRAARQRRSRGQKRGRTHLTSVNDGNSIDLMCADEELLAVSRSSRQRRSRGQMRGRSSMASVTNSIPVDLTCSDEERSADSSYLNTSRSARQRSRRPRNARRSRAPVISLDVTYSSDELDISDLERTPSPEKNPRSFFHLTFTPSPEPSDTKSPASSPLYQSPPDSPLDKKEDEKEEGEAAAALGDVEDKEADKAQIVFSDSDEEEDLFNVDYNLKREKALLSALKEIKEVERDVVEERSTPKDSLSRSESPVTVVSDDEPPPKKKSSSLDFSSITPVKVPKKKLVKNSKKVEKARLHLQKISEELSEIKANGKFDGDLSVLTDEEDDKDAMEENQTFTAFIKWESNYIRWQLRQFQKFSTVYKEVADRFSQNVAQVLLCHDDKVISPDSCPKDLNLKFGDIIECGVQSQPSMPIRESSLKQNPDAIPLKVQNSERKGTVVIHIGRKSKMLELMHRYAEEKNLNIKNLCFKFDGEVLDPTDTPETLDLEGDECIDVFMKS